MASMPRPCAADDCTKPSRAQGLCWACYAQMRRELAGGFPRSTDPRQRIVSRVDIDPETGCWVHRLTGDRQGYGRITYRGQAWKVHRLAYTAFVGPIPDGLVIDHLCRNTRCANPAHLEPVTNAENVRRGFAARRDAVAD